MLKFMLHDIMAPLLRRFSSNASTVLVTLGATATQVDTITLGITALAGFGLDLILSKQFGRK